MKNVNNSNWRLERAKKIVELIHTGIENEDGDIRKFNIFMISFFDLVFIIHIIIF